MERRITRVRALAVFAVAGAVLAVALLSPVGAAVTKTKVKKIAVKQANKVVQAEAVQLGTAKVNRSETEIDLGPSYSTVNTTSITTHGGMLLATGNVKLRDTVDGTNQVECRLIIGTFPTGTVIDHWIGNVQQAASNDGSRRVVYPLSGGAAVAAGTHTVTIFCGEAAAQTGVKHDGSSLVVWEG